MKFVVRGGHKSDVTELYLEATEAGVYIRCVTSDDDYWNIAKFENGKLILCSDIGDDVAFELDKDAHIVVEKE